MAEDLLELVAYDQSGLSRSERPHHMVMYDLTLCTVWSNMIMSTVLIDQYRLPLAIAYSAHV